VLYIGTNLVQFYSRVQRWVSTSTGESEMNEIHRTTQSVLTIQGLMKDLRFKPTLKTATIFSDSATAEFYQRRSYQVKVKALSNKD